MCDADPYLLASHKPGSGPQKLPADRCDAWGPTAGPAIHPWSCERGKHFALLDSTALPSALPPSRFNITSMMLTDYSSFTLKLKSAGMLFLCSIIHNKLQCIVHSENFLLEPA